MLERRRQNISSKVWQTNFTIDILLCTVVWCLLPEIMQMHRLVKSYSFTELQIDYPDNFEYLAQPQNAAAAYSTPMNREI